MHLEAYLGREAGGERPFGGIALLDAPYVYVQYIYI